MPRKKQRNEKANSELPLRISVTFPRELYQTLQDLAKRKKVSTAWLVRDAAEKYVAEMWPLFSGSKGE